MLNGFFTVKRQRCLSKGWTFIKNSFPLAMWNLWDTSGHYIILVVTIAICNDPSGVLRTFLLLKTVFVQHANLWMAFGMMLGFHFYFSIKNQEVHLPQKTGKWAILPPNDWFFFFDPYCISFWRGDFGWKVGRGWLLTPGDLVGTLRRWRACFFK